MNKFSLLKEVIDEWDPFDLLAIHCLDDEYDIEIQNIVEVLPYMNDSEELANEIKRIMFKALNEDFKKLKDCLMIAKKIFMLLK